MIGLTQAAAEARLAQAGLKPQAQAVKSLAASGMVIAQKPVPGTRVKRGAVVLLKVSRGKPALAVPDVTGLTAAQGHDPGLVANPSDLVEREHARTQDEALVGKLRAEDGISHGS